MMTHTISFPTDPSSAKVNRRAPLLLTSVVVRACIVCIACGGRYMAAAVVYEITDLLINVEILNITTLSIQMHAYTQVIGINQ